MGLFSSFFHPEKGYEKALEEMQRYYQQSQALQKPYNQFGQQAYGDLSGAMQSLLNPEDLQARFQNAYTESPSAKYAENLAGEHGLNAASSMGLLGSTPAMQVLQEGKSRIGLEDRDSYIHDLMQQYLQGAGIAGNIYNTGAATAGQMGQNAMNMGQNSAQLAYNRENAPGGMFGSLLGLGGGLLGSALGGPIGGSLAKRWNLSGGA